LSPSPAPLQDVVQRARVHEQHPLDREATGDLVRRLVFSLDADARYDDVDERPGLTAVPVAAFAPAFILRRRLQHGLVAVFEQIAAAIAATGQVPLGLLPLLDPDHRLVVKPDPTDGAMVDVDDEVFLPLPLNDRQLDIIQRVDRQAQTLVQGKRVLVTAHTDRALKEVRGKLPEAIKPLAVAVVGTDRSDMADLKVAVERISCRSSDGDPEALDAEARAGVQASLASAGGGLQLDPSLRPPGRRHALAAHRAGGGALARTAPRHGSCAG
jgi:hypothetical protein